MYAGVLKRCGVCSFTNVETYTLSDKYTHHYLSVLGAVNVTGTAVILVFAELREAMSLADEHGTKRRSPLRLVRTARRNP